MDTQNLGRAALQGLTMGWGDEGEAWLRSKLLNESYEDELNRVRKEYGKYAKDNPITSAATEFAGGVIPGVLTAGLGTGASTLGTVARQGGLGALQGALSGAGAAESDRSSGAVSGGVLGGALGVAIPTLMRGAGAAGKWIGERKAAYAMPDDAAGATFAEKMANTPVQVRDRALDLLSSAAKPSEIDAVMAADRAAKIPSVVANVSPSAAKLTRGVAKMGGAGGDKIEDALMAQRLGTGERAYDQTVAALKPGNYYDDLKSLQDRMRNESGPAYQKAYSHGEVADPTVLSFMKLPQFQQGAKEAERLLAAEGRTVDMSKPTVEVLDQVKRGLDALIEKETDAITGKTSSLGRVYTLKKNEFLNALDAAVPDYGKARSVYAGGAELRDAMDKGMKQFKTMDHEQVEKLVAGMHDAEKQAFRTGVARDMYGKIMAPSGNFNAAQRVFGSPEAQKKLRPLFDSDGEFNLFKAAMERESQLFRHSSRILGGSDTAENIALKETIKGDSGIGKAIGNAAMGDFRQGLSGMVMGLVNSTRMTDKTASRLADMLMAKDPHEVAAVVKLLETHAANAAPKAVKSGIRQAGATSGVIGSIYPAPSAGETMPDLTELSDEIEKPRMSGRALIEADLAK